MGVALPSGDLVLAGVTVTDGVAMGETSTVGTVGGTCVGVGAGSVGEYWTGPGGVLRAVGVTVTFVSGVGVIRPVRGVC